MYPPQPKPKPPVMDVPQALGAPVMGMPAPLTATAGAGQDWAGLVQQSQNLYGGTFGAPETKDAGAGGFQPDWQMPGGGAFNNFGGPAMGAPAPITAAGYNDGDMVGHAVPAPGANGEPPKGGVPPGGVTSWRSDDPNQPGGAGGGIGGPSPAAPARPPAPAYTALGVPASTYGGIQLPPELQPQDPFSFAEGAAPGTFKSSSQVQTPNQFTYQQGTTPANFSYAGFRPTTMDDVRADPGYQGVLDEGLGAIENAASAKGLTRNVNTLQALNRGASDYAARQFENVNARRMAEHQQGYGQARDTAGFNVENTREAEAAEFGKKLAAQGYNDQAIRQAQTDRFGQEFATHTSNVETQRNDANDRFGRAFSTAGYNRDSQYGTYDRAVDAATLRDRSARETEADALDRNVMQDARDFRGLLYESGERQFDLQYQSGERRFDREQTQREREFTSSDQFRRSVQADEATYRAARDRETDAWKREVMDEERRRFLAELGAR